MPDEFLADDYGLSSDFQFVEEFPDEVPAFPQALWFGVRPGYGTDDQRLPEPTIWVQYQGRYMNSQLDGMVAISPRGWDKLDEAVRWRLAAWKELYAKRNVPAAGPGTAGSGDPADPDQSAQDRPGFPFPDGD